MSNDPVVDDMVKRAAAAQAKVIFDGMPRITIRDWDNLFPNERKLIVDLIIEADQAWWGVVNAFADERRITNDAIEAGKGDNA